MKLYKSISPKNLDKPILFEETSQKIYSFEGFIYYGLKNWMEASELIDTETFRKWLAETLQLTKEAEVLNEILLKKCTDGQKLLLLFKGTSFISEPVLRQLELEILFWEDQPLEVQMKKRGDQAFFEKRYAKAVKYYKLAQLEVFDPIVEHNIGAAYMHLNFFVEAERALHRALKHSDVLEIHISLLRLLKITNRTNEAIARAKDLMIRYQRWEVYFECGTIYLIKRQYVQAFEAFTKAYELDPQAAVLIKMIETSLLFQTIEETYSLLEALKEKNEEAYCIHRSRILVQENRVDEALEVLEDGLRVYKKSKEIPLEISKVCRLKKQIIKAINAVIKAQKNGADKEELLYEMALIAKRAGNRKDYIGKLDELKKHFKASIRSKYKEV